MKHFIAILLLLLSIMFYSRKPATIKPYHLIPLSPHQVKWNDEFSLADCKTILADGELKMKLVFATKLCKGKE